MLCLHRRLTDFSELYQVLSNSISDPDDIEVVLDAHDLACSIPGLVFWTGDYAHIICNRKQIVYLTGLCDIRYLGAPDDLL